MAYLEKKILVTIPVTEAHKTYLEKQASSGKYNCQFRYIPKEHVTKEDLEDTQVLIGNLPPALVREAKRLEWLQLNSAGADPYTPEGVLRPEQSSRTPPGPMAWRYPSICWP